MSYLLPIGSVIAGRYRIEEYIGKGGMQQVFRATDLPFERAVAVKTPITESAGKRFKRSAVISARVSHPNVAKTIDYVEGTNPILVEEYVAGRDLKTALFKITRRLDPSFVARLAHHLARGLRAAHEAGIVHRDIKPSNVLLEGGFAASEVKITDFGIATMTEDVLIEAARSEESRTASTTMMGALPYMAPEAIANPKAATAASDVWSIGAMMYEMLAGRTPYGDGMAAALNIGAGKAPARPAVIDANAQLRDLGTAIFELALSCMSIDPANRPTAANVVESFQSIAYDPGPRYVGQVNNFIYNGTQGFIVDSVSGETVYFHTQCVYGDMPTVDSRVLYARFPGDPRDRAFPVMKI